MSEPDLVEMYRRMVRIREFEERVKRTFAEHPGVIRGHTHLADGAEASIVGSLAALRPGDQLTSTYRCHGYPIALGTDTGALMAEIYGRSTGVCGGYGGSMHFCDPERGFLGCWPQLPVASGDIAYLREKQKELNAMIAAQAAANGAGLIDWYRASIGHDACKPPAVRWVEPLVPANAAAPVHPNLLGMIGAANLVVAAAGG